MAKSAAIKGTVLVILFGGAIGGLIYLVFKKNDAYDAQQAPVVGPQAAPVDPEPVVEEAVVGAEAPVGAEATGGSRKRKSKGKRIKKRKSKRKSKKH
jgi:hypothetical protein